MGSRLKYKLDSQVVPSDVESFHYQRYTVDNGIDSSRAVQFLVEGQPDCFVDLNSCYLKTEFRIVKEDGGEIGSNPLVFPTESYGSNLWSQVNINLNGSSLPSGNEYPYTAYLIELLGSNGEVRANVQETLNGFGVPGYGSSEVKYSKEASYRDQKRLCKKSQTITVYSRIHSDFMMSCSHLLPNNMSIGIQLQRSKDDFVLGATTTTVKDSKTNEDIVQGPDPVKIQVESVSLFVKRICLTSTALATINKSLSTGGTLQYQRLHTLAFSCPKNTKTWNWRNCFSNIAPRKVFVGLVTQDAYFGDLKRTSNFFESAGISTVSFALDGREIMAEPYKCSFKYDGGKIDKNETEARSAFAGLCRTIGSFTATMQGLGVSYDQFISGATVFATSLDHADTDVAVPGSLDVSISFEKATENAYMVIVMGEFPKTISFDANRKLI